MRQLFKASRWVALAATIVSCIGGPVVKDPPVSRANCDVYGECSYKAPNQP